MPAQKALPKKRNRADRSVSVSIENLHIVSTSVQSAAQVTSQRCALRQLRQTVEQRRLQLPNESFRDRMTAAISAVHVPDGMCPSYFTRFRAFSTLGNRMLSTPTTKHLGEALDHHAKMHVARREGSDALQEAWKSVVTQQNESPSGLDEGFTNRHQVTRIEANELLAAKLTNRGRIQHGPIKPWFKRPRPVQSDDQRGATETIERAEHLLFMVHGCGVAGKTASGP